MAVAPESVSVATCAFIWGDDATDDGEASMRVLYGIVSWDTFIVSDDSLQCSHLRQ
jgi:hypothetical protein